MDGDDPAAGPGQLVDGAVEELAGVGADRAPARAGSLPCARPISASTRRACSAWKSSTAAEFWPSCSGTSTARRKRVIPIQKSSRTRTSACRRRPSHWRIACKSSDAGIVEVVMQPLLELIENDQHLGFGAIATVPSRRAAAASARLAVAGRPGNFRRRAASRRDSVPSAEAST